MTCDEVRRHWNLFHDSEGDAPLHFQLGEHLAVCPSCEQWYAAQDRLETAIVRRLRDQRATPELWDAVLNRRRARPFGAHRWLAWSGAAGVAAMLVIGLLLYRVSSVRSDADLAQLGGARHEQLANGTQAIDFRTGSDLDAEAYLRKVVSFPVRCPPRKDSGFAVHGVGVCELADQPAAYLTGSVDDAPISIFVLARDSLDAFPRQDQALRGQRLIRSQRGQWATVLGVIDRNAVLVVGRTEPARLERVLNAYGTYPEHP